MDKLLNPFTPGAGFMPPELAGREAAIENGHLVARRTRLLRAERGMMLIGPRGVGKTALIKHLAEMARQEGIVPIVSEIRDDGRAVEELAVKLKEALTALDMASKFKGSVREAFGVLSAFVKRFSINIGSFGIEVETNEDKDTSGNLEFDLAEVLLSVARAAKASGSALGLYLDELQNMHPETLSGIIVALHHAAQDLLPIYLIGSGLPTIRTIVGKSKTYAERMFIYEEIGPLDESAASDAIRIPLQNAGVEIEEVALSELCAESRGYPFFLQELGYWVWQRAAKSPIVRDDVLQCLPEVSRNLDRNFFDVRFDRISMGERRFLRAMADASDTEEKDLHAIAAVLKKKPTALSMTRRSLIRKGMIYSPRQGTLAYTVPMFAEYIRRAMPEVEGG